MKSGALPVLFLAAALSVFPACGPQAKEEPALVPIARYANNDDALAKEGARASSILRDHKIKSVSAGSASLTLSVPAEKAGQARALLAKAIKDDGLRINLLKEESKDDQPGDEKILTSKLGEILTETAALKAGGKRSDLEKHFTIEGGLSTASQRTYVSKRCSFIKVDVTFRPLNAQKESPGDAILKVSKPYLAYNVID